MFVGLLFMSLVKSFTYLVQSSTNASMIQCTDRVCVGLVKCIPCVFVFIISISMMLVISNAVLDSLPPCPMPNICWFGVFL